MLFTKWTRSPISVLMTIDDLPNLINIGTDAPYRHPQALLLCSVRSLPSAKRVRVRVIARVCVLGRHTSDPLQTVRRQPTLSEPCAASLRCSTPTSPLRRLRP